MSTRGYRQVAVSQTCDKSSNGKGKLLVYDQFRREVARNERFRSMGSRSNQLDVEGQIGKATYERQANNER